MRGGYGRSDEGRERPYGLSSRAPRSPGRAETAALTLDGQRLFARPAAASRARSSLSPCRFGLSPDAFAALAPAAFAGALRLDACLRLHVIERAPAPAPERLPCDGPSMAASIVTA